MDADDVWEKLAFLALILIFLLVSTFLRGRRAAKTQLGVVLSLLSEVNYNQKLMEAFSYNLKVKKFKTASWKVNKGKMDFIDQELQTSLAKAYEIAERFNLDIDAAHKHKLATYLASIQVDKLKEPLACSKQGLEEWLKLNTVKEKTSKKGV